MRIFIVLAHNRCLTRKVSVSLSLSLLILLLCYKHFWSPHVLVHYPRSSERQKLNILGPVLVEVLPGAFVDCNKRQDEVSVPQRCQVRQVGRIRGSFGRRRGTITFQLSGGDEERAGVREQLMLTCGWGDSKRACNVGWERKMDGEPGSLHRPYMPR